MCLLLPLSIISDLSIIIEWGVHISCVSVRRRLISNGRGGSDLSGPVTGFSCFGLKSSLSAS